MSKPKTVKVRVAVAVDEDGDWNAMGWSRDKAGRAPDLAAAPLGRDCSRYILTAELEIPEPREVAAEVEKP